MSRKRKKLDVSLLPFERSDLYGLSPYDNQFSGWEINKFHIQEKWKESKGEDVVVAVIDTGCDYNHLDIKDNILSGISFVDKKDCMDDNGHGTHVCSTIAATDNAIGMVGIAPRAKIIPVKALDAKGQGNLKSLVEAILWASNSIADIVTMSLGSSSFSKEIQDAINYGHNNGKIFFCAAGNSGENQDILYPAACKNTIAIGAIDSDLKRTVFTCAGEELDFLCPGQDILGCVPNNNYAIMSGTSMANPFAVGCAALYISKLKKRNITASLDDIINVFKQSAKDIDEPKYRSKKYQGYGILYPV